MTTTMDGIEGRTPTGIRGFDEMTKGGFVTGDSILLSGSAGLGKTTFGLQFLYNGVKNYNEPGVMLTFEELPQQIYRDARNFGWDIRKLEEEGQMKVICTSADTVTDPDVLATVVDKELESVHAKRMLIDSLTVVEVFAQELNKRATLYRFVNHFKTRKVTTLMTYEAQEMFGGMQARGINPMSYLVDAVINLRHAELNGELRRTIAVMKMRGSDHDKDIKEYTITNKGFELRASLKGYEGLLTGTPRLASKLSSALESL